MKLLSLPDVFKKTYETPKSSEISEVSKVPNRKGFLFFLWSLLLVVLVFSSIFTWWLLGESKECVTNPLVYGINKADENLKCSCMGDKHNFMIDEKGFRNKNNFVSC